MKQLIPIDYLGHRAWPTWGWLALLLCALGLAWQGWGAAEESRLLQREREGTSALLRSARGNPKPMSAEERQRHAQIEAVARYLATPWQVWLGVLEDHANGQAIVRRLEQDASNESLKITARSADATAMMAYVIALQTDARLKEVRLISHEVQRGEPGTPLQFELTASARAPGVAEAASAPDATTAGGNRP